MVKRLFDIFVSSVGLVTLSPILIFVALLVRINLGAPVLFIQLRPGFEGKPFQILKFRTMREARDANGSMLSDAARLTRFGKFLRASSLDELPELWNVLKGDLSLVGPRPLLIDYLPLYSAEQARRHEVKPGITGWAQVNGRNTLTWEEKFMFDLWYVENRSMMLDLRILLITMLQVMRRKGISNEGHATMPEFKGSPSSQ